ncbi:MAG TPA: OprD family outer membrane porin [Methylomirabilota bacterium]|nr:OprD family outer membrane porin [Methylomirabilota bacterium]
MSARGWQSALALILAVGVGPSMATAQPAPKPGPAQPAPGVSQQAPILQEDVTVRSPDAAPPPPPQMGLLETGYPALREEMSKLDPFFRDTDLNVRLRTFYFNRQNDNDTANEAWALGGWVQYASGWLLDTFAIGSTYYTSWPLYTPDGREGTVLLTPDHDAIGVFGEAWAALRYKEYALFRGYRQKIDDGYVSPQDNRMVPNTFEAVTLSGKLDWVRYNVGYLWNIKPRDSNDFISMSRQAGAAGSDEGLILTSVAFTPMKDLLIYAGNYYATEVFNTFFGKIEHTRPLTKDLTLQAGLQFTDQRSVGDDRLGNFNTWNVGAGARLLFKGLAVGAATHFTGDEASIRSPWGSWPGYLSLMVTDFDRANEKAFGVGVKYDFGGALLPLQLPGLTVHLLYAMGADREDPATGNSLANTHEGNLDVIYNVPQVKGLSLRFRNAYVGRGDASTLVDYRVIINYELDLL